MTELNALYKCHHCYIYTPRDNMFCVACGVKLPTKELKGKLKDNNPMPDARRLPSNYKKLGER